MESEELLADRVGVGVTRIGLRTPTLPPATHTNAYFVGREDFLVVEPASPFGAEQSRLFAAVEERRARGHRVVGALLTHHHADHVGAAWALRARFGVPVMAHPETARRLRARGPVDIELREGDALPPCVADLELTLLHTPGHAPGHLCVHAEKHGWLIAGDMVASVGTILVDVDDGGDMDDYLTQLQRLAVRAPGTLLPAHGEPIADGVERLRFYVRHRLQREAKILDAVRGGARELGEVVARAYDDTPVTVWPLAARAARAHLARLEKLQRVTLRGGRYLSLV